MYIKGMHSCSFSQSYITCEVVIEKVKWQYTLTWSIVVQL